MTIYSLLLLLILLIPLFDKQKDIVNNSKSKKFKYTYLVLIFMILIPGLRDISVGLDTQQYNYIYDKYSTSFFDSETRLEQGYLILNKLVHDVFDSFIWMQVITSSLFIIPLYWLSSKYSSKVWLSLMLFVVYIFYYMCFNEMRQAIAMGISCIAFFYLVQCDWKKYLMFVLVSCFFHHTAAVLFPLVVLNYIDRFKMWHAILCVIGFCMTTVFFSVIFSYIGSMQAISYENDGSAGGFGLLAMQILILVLAIYKKDCLFNEKQNLYAFYYIVCAVIIFPICHTTPVMFRLEQYFWLPMIILVPNILASFRNELIQNIGVLAFVTIGYFFLFISQFSEHNQIIPYVFYFSK